MRPEIPENHAPHPIVVFAAGRALAWPAVRDLLAQHGVSLKMRMIDGQPAFPDEEPPEAWREIRVAAADGMATIRRDGDRVVFVTWGNASQGLLQVVNALAWAFATAGSGTVDHQEAAAFLRSADVPDSLKSAASP